MRCATSCPCHVLHGDHHAEVVAEIDPLEDTAEEPRRACHEQRSAISGLDPFAACELVDLITRLAPEQRRELALGLGHRVYSQPGRGSRDQIGRVLLRDAREKMQRVHAHLGRETDYAPCARAVRAGGDDVDRSRAGAWEARVGASHGCSVR